MRDSRALGSALIVGWILMAPPLTSDSKGTRIDPASEPVAEWRQVRATDTAAACESLRDREINGATQAAQKFSGKKDVSGDLMVMSAIASRCVPAEHVYPSRVDDVRTE